MPKVLIADKLSPQAIDVFKQRGVILERAIHLLAGFGDFESKVKLPGLLTDRVGRQAQLTAIETCGHVRARDQPRQAIGSLRFMKNEACLKDRWMTRIPA